MNIFELTQEEIKLKEMLENIEDYEMTDEEKEQIIADTLGDAVEEKLEGYGKIHNEINSVITAIDAEIERLKAMKERKQKAVERLDNNVLFYMVNTGKDECKAGIYSYKRKVSYSTGVIDESLVPEEYIRVKVEEKKSVDKASALKVLKTGETIPGLILSKNEKVVLK